MFPRARRRGNFDNHRHTRVPVAPTRPMAPPRNCSRRRTWRSPFLPDRGRYGWRRGRVAGVSKSRRRTSHRLGASSNPVGEGSAGFASTWTVLRATMHANRQGGRCPARSLTRERPLVRWREHARCRDAENSCCRRSAVVSPRVACRARRWTRVCREPGRW